MAGIPGLMCTDGMGGGEEAGQEPLKSNPVRGGKPHCHCLDHTGDHCGQAKRWIWKATYGPLPVTEGDKGP